MMIRLQLFILTAFLVIPVTMACQDRCLVITSLPNPEKPREENFTTLDEATADIFIRFNANGKLGEIAEVYGGREIDRIAREAARKITFSPKLLDGKSVTVERHIFYTYSYKTGRWKMSAPEGKCFTLSETLTDAQENRLRETAREFVANLMRTHDLRPLLQKWFIPNFEMAADFELETIPTDLFRNLTAAVRKRILLAFWNAVYAQLVINQSKPKSLECYDDSPACNQKRRQALLRLLSEKTVSLMEARERDGESKPLTKRQLLADSELMETVFSEALSVLRRRNLEQSPEFQHWIKLFEDDYHLEYLIKESQADRDVLDPQGRKIIAKGEMVYGVETPLILRFDFVWRGNTFKIYNIAGGDGD